MPVEIAHRTQRDQQIKDYAEFKAELEPMPQLSSKEATIVTLQPKAVEYVEGLIESRKGMQRSLEALLASMITDSWTAFECLASDLWVAGVDYGPGWIHGNLEVAPDKVFDRPADNIKQETIRELAELGIDARGNYGSFLRAVEKVSFDKLHKIKSLYEAAFGKEAAQLFDQIENGYIYALAAVRNVLTHTSGKADKNLCRRSSDFLRLRKTRWRVKSFPSTGDW